MAEWHCGGVLSSQRYEQSNLLFPEQSESLSLLPRSVPRSSLRPCRESAHQTPEVCQPQGSHQWSSTLSSRTLLFRARVRRSTAAQPSGRVRRKARAALCPTATAKPDIPLSDRAHAALAARPPNFDQCREDARKPPALRVA